MKLIIQRFDELIVPTQGEERHCPQLLLRLVGRMRSMKPKPRKRD
jgi:hypothetical protein